jgi:hypothetical protein
MIDLEAIRRRNEKSKRVLHEPVWFQDIDALLAEVERLRHVAGECECRPPTQAANGLVGSVCGYAATACEFCGKRHEHSEMTFLGIPVVECPEAPQELTFRTTTARNT